MTVSRLNSLFVEEDSLLGIESRTQLAQRVASSVSDIQGDAWRLTGQQVDPSFYDAIEIVFAESDGTVHESIELSLIEFMAIPTAAQHDTLSSATARLETTASGTLFIGRTNANVVLVQAVTYTNTFANFTVSTIGLSTGRGLLDRRVAAAQYPQGADRFAVTFASSKPDAPAATRITVDSAKNISIAADANEAHTWDEINSAPAAGTGDRYILHIRVTWSSDQAQFVAETLGVYDWNDSYDGGFSSSSTGVYQLADNPLWQDAWVRIRTPAGPWIVAAIRQTATIISFADPVQIAAFSMGSGVGTTEITVDFDWSNRRKITLLMEQWTVETSVRTTANRERLARAEWYADDVECVADGSGNTYDRRSLFARLSTDGSSWGMGAVNNESLANSNSSIMRLNFEPVSGGAAGDQRCGKFVFRRWNTGRHWDVKISAE